MLVSPIADDGAGIPPLAHPTAESESILPVCRTELVLFASAS